MTYILTLEQVEQVLLVVLSLGFVVVGLFVLFCGFGGFFFYYLGLVRFACLFRGFCLVCFLFLFLCHCCQLAIIRQKRVLHVLFMRVHLMSGMRQSLVKYKIFVTLDTSEFKCVLEIQETSLLGLNSTIRKKSI